jgi:PhnB protein
MKRNKKSVKKIVKRTTPKAATKASRTVAPGKGTRRVATRKPGKKKVQAVPKGYTAVTPHLVCKDTAGAMDFYTKAFGAKDKGRMTGPNGVVVHGEMRIGDAVIMLGEEMPDMGALSPLAIGGSPVSMMLYVKDVDAAFARATAAGCTVVMPPANMFWGDRYCRVTDPYGHQWAIATHIEDLSMKEMGRRMAAEFSQA